MRKPNSSSALAPGDTARGNRRKWVRHACGPEVSCRLLVGEDTAFAVEQIQNLSAGGISLVLTDLVPTGKVLTVELRRDERRAVVRREARVTYLFRTPDGRFTMGGAFAWELGLRELEQLL